MTPEDLDRLEHILEAAERVATYAAAGQQAFEAEEMRQDAIVRNLEIIGEATGRLSQELRAAHPDVPWRDVIAHRNVLIHDYRRLVQALIWRVATEDLPTFAKRVKEIAWSARRD